MRRFFTMFAHGAAGAGLLIMRIAGGGALLVHGVSALTAATAPDSAALHIACAATGLCLVVGLWTPIVGALVAVGAAAHGFFNPADGGFFALVAALGAALALLGPGAWSVDARLFGWRRIEIREADGGANRHH